jgi:EAL domain-containing protein (putative c-di-GMP-specific phosphodiesterase class I)
VESVDELRALRSMQVAYAQGYYFARPAPDLAEPKVVLP